MKVSDIIKTLEAYDPNDSVVIAWWEREAFDPDLVSNLSLEDWAAACKYMEFLIDWSYAHEVLDDIFKVFLKEKHK